MHTNQSEMVAIFLDYDIPTSPYDGLALRVKVLDDLVFLAIGTFTEGDGKDVGVETFRFDDRRSIGVDAEQLYQALGTMLRRSDREAYGRLVDGRLPTDHPSLRMQPLTVITPMTRTRA